MRLFTRRSLGSERSRAEIEAALESSQERQALYLRAIRVLLYCVKEFALDLTELEAERFKEQMDTLAGHFFGDARPVALQRLLVEYRDVILAYIAREKDYLRDREAEFKNIIAILTTGLTALGEANQEFNARMYERSVKLERLTYLDDIRRMKEELRHEVQQMQHYVQEK